MSVDAGVEWDEVVNTAIALRCGGVELMSGIPGLAGAAPIQNIAAYGQQICDSIDSIEVFDRSNGHIVDLDVDECGFAFRTSRFKTDWLDRFVITRVRLQLHEVDARPLEPSTYVDLQRWFEMNDGSATAIGDRRQAVLATRRRKSMLLDPGDPLARSVGSFFINPSVPIEFGMLLRDHFDTHQLPVRYLEGRSAGPPTHMRVPAAHVLRYAGFNAGDSWGPVKLSDKHVLAVITRQGATARDVYRVTRHIQRRVEETCGVSLDTEARLIGRFEEFDADEFDREYRYEPASDAEPEWLAGYRR